jgi:hypothetical protein
LLSNFNRLTAGVPRVEIEQPAFPRDAAGIAGQGAIGSERTIPGTMMETGFAS